jgi:hypothetical protein
MFWVALSVLIMNLTGVGDDTYAFRKLLERLREAVAEQVHDPARRKAATQALDRATGDFSKHRARLGKISACIERADRTYAASKQDYERCLADLGPAWHAAGDDLIRFDRSLSSALTPAELSAVQRASEQ